VERLSRALGALWPGTDPSLQAQDDHLVSFSPPRVGEEISWMWSEEKMDARLNMSGMTMFLMNGFLKVDED